jgi:hypothetical protein
MFTIRSTRRLLDRLRVSPERSTDPPSTRLGDWYANLLALEACGEYLLCVSEKTFLPVVLPITALSNIALGLSKALVPVLAELGIERDLIDQERFAMAQSTFGTTASRHIVGFMNEFAFMASTRLAEEPTSLTELSLWLAGTPCRICFPDQATQELFSSCPPS